MHFDISVRTEIYLYDEKIVQHVEPRHKFVSFSFSLSCLYSVYGLKGQPLFIDIFVICCECFVMSTHLCL